MAGAQGGFHSSGSGDSWQYLRRGCMVWFDRNAVWLVLGIAAIGIGFGAIVTMTVCTPQIL
jgi:hypothetical protein